MKNIFGYLPTYCKLKLAQYLQTLAGWEDTRAGNKFRLGINFCRTQHFRETTMPGQRTPLLSEHSRLVMQFSCSVLPTLHVGLEENKTSAYLLKDFKQLISCNFYYQDRCNFLNPAA